MLVAGPVGGEGGGGGIGAGWGVKIHCCVNMLPALHFMSCVSAALFTKTDPLLHRLTPAISQHGSWHPLREKRLLQLVVLQYALVKRYPIYMVAEPTGSGTRQ